jgi:integrase
MPKTAKHPGVVLCKPSGGRTLWRARFLDPDSGRQTWESLDQGLNAEQRVHWAVAKSKQLVTRRFELHTGAARHTAKPLDKEIEGFFAAHPHLRASTEHAYRRTAKDFLQWCADQGLTTTDDVGPTELFNFREALIQRPKFKVLRGKGAGRGKRIPSDERRSAFAINQQIRAIRRVLGYLVRKRILSKLRRDDLEDALEQLQTNLEQPEFLKPAQIAKLLEAAATHDKQTFKITRDDKAAGIYKSTQERYEPITPFVLVVLLTGMRASEVINLAWDAVDLEAGDIHLRATATKTKIARRVDLLVSPLLVSVLKTLHASRDKSEPRVFPHITGKGEAEMKRLRACGAPAGFTWQILRSTCDTYLANAPGIYGGASAYLAAKRTGHSVEVAERHYLGLTRIPKEATTLEAAMRIAVAAPAEAEPPKTLPAQPTRSFAHLN